MIPPAFMHGNAVMRYFSMLTIVATPQTIAAQELRIEWFPADDETEAAHLALMDER